MKNRSQLRRVNPYQLIILPLVAFTGCGETAPPAITVGAVSFAEDELLGLSPARRVTLAQLTALALAVADSSTDQLGEPLLEKWENDRLLDIFAAELTLQKNGVDDAVLKAQYLTDPEWELTVRHILFFSERWRDPLHRTAARAKAARAMELLNEGADFAETAMQLSEAPGAEGRQGLLTPGREGFWVPEFWDAALALQPGEISPVTETEYGYHILRLEDREMVPFREARTVFSRAVANRIEDPRVTLEAWLDDNAGETEGTRHSKALAESVRLELKVPAGEITDLARVWDEITYRWSNALGFRYGLGTSEIADAALGALANSSQNATIARNELAEHDAMLRARYEFILASPQG